MAALHTQIVSDFLQQTEHWVNKDGYIPIETMNTTHRRRAAQFLLRRSRFFGVWDLDDRPDEHDNYVQEFVGRLAAPVVFMKSTPLYQRLIEDGADPELHERWLVEDGDD